MKPSFLLRPEELSLIKFIIAHCGAFHSFTRLSSPTPPPSSPLADSSWCFSEGSVCRVRGVRTPFESTLKASPDEPVDRFLLEDSKLRFVRLSDVPVFFFGSVCCVGCRLLLLPDRHSSTVREPTDSPPPNTPHLSPLHAEHTPIDERRRALWDIEFYTLVSISIKISVKNNCQLFVSFQ